MGKWLRGRNMHNETGISRNQPWLLRIARISSQRFQGQHAETLRSIKWDSLGINKNKNCKGFKYINYV